MFTPKTKKPCNYLNYRALIFRFVTSVVEKSNFYTSLEMVLDWKASHDLNQ